MRLSARDISFKVAAIPSSVRPIRVRGGGLTYMLTSEEAVDLATQLADAVSEIRTLDQRSTP